MRHPRTIITYTAQDSFLSHLYKDFYINSYKDEEPEVLNRVESHRHTYYEIIWVRSGEGIHTIDFIDYKFSGPCLFLLHPQNIHTINKAVPATGGVIKFTISVFSASTEESDFMLRYGVFDDIDVLPVIPLTIDQSDEIGKLFDDVYKEYHSQSSFSIQIIISYLKIFLLKIYAIKKSHLPADLLKSADLLRFRQFQQLLETYFKKHHGASFYAEQLNLTGKTLGNVTHNLSNLSPSQLIKQRILLEAKRLLHHSSLSVKEIAYELGFEDSSYFIRFFKINTQSSPQQYKKQH